MSEKRCLRNAAEDYCFFGNSKRTLYVQVPMTMSEKKLSKSQFVILNARFSTFNVHLLLQTCVYFVNSPDFLPAEGREKRQEDIKRLCSRYG